MFDFYALYALWWDLGSGRSVYGHSPTHVSFAGRQRRIDWMMAESAQDLAEALLEDVWNAACAEATHAVEDYVIPTQEAWQWFKQDKDRMRFGQVLIDRMNDWHSDGVAARGAASREFVTWEDLADLFGQDFWQLTGYTDEDGTRQEQHFGGSPWSDICYAARDLQRKLETYRNSDNDRALVTLIGAVDHLYDLEHNSATLGEKLERMEVTTSDLNRRATMKSAIDFLPVTSPPVAALLRAAEAEISRYEEGFIKMIRAQEIQLFEELVNE